jgi:hypothetical protein
MEMFPDCRRKLQEEVSTEEEIRSSWAILREHAVQEGRRFLVTEFQADYRTSAFELTESERADESALDGLVGTLGRCIPDDVEDTDSCIIVQGCQDMVELGLLRRDTLLAENCFRPRKPNLRLVRPPRRKLHSDSLNGRRVTERIMKDVVVIHDQGVKLSGSPLKENGERAAYSGVEEKRLNLFCREKQQQPSTMGVSAAESPHTPPQIIK